MGGSPKVNTPVQAQPTADELARQAEAEKAAADAAERARVEKLQLEETAAMDRRAVASGLRGRRSLLSSAGEVGFSTGLGGI